MRFGIAIFLSLLSLMTCACRASLAEDKVHEVTQQLPEFPDIDITDPDHFLNDLKLSPFWKVEQLREGPIVALARSIHPDSPFEENGRMLLLDLIQREQKTLPTDYQIRNRYLPGRDTFSTFSVAILFHQLNTSRSTVGQSGQKAILDIYDFTERRLGPNSRSELVVKLSSQHEIYLILREQGADPSRNTTLTNLPRVLKDLDGLEDSPEIYRVEERYAEFFDLFFQPPLGDQALQRFPGLQDRDTFYGYFRTQGETQYDGVNLKVSHPVYCPEECTRPSARLGKAELLGQAYVPSDTLFFLIEDNAVYLPEEHNAEFGTFSGNRSFEGDVEVLNGEGAVLLKTRDQFKGWER